MSVHNSKKRSATKYRFFFYKNLEKIDLPEYGSMNTLSSKVAEVHKFELFLSNYSYKIDYMLKPSTGFKPNIYYTFLLECLYSNLNFL